MAKVIRKIYVFNCGSGENPGNLLTEELEELAREPASVVKKPEVFLIE